MKSNSVKRYVLSANSGANLVYFGLFTLVYLHHFGNYNNWQLICTELTETQPWRRVLRFDAGGRPSSASGLWSVHLHRCTGHRLCQLNVRLVQTHMVDAELHGWWAARCSSVDWRTQGCCSHVRVPLACQIGAEYSLQQLKQKWLQDFYTFIML